MTKLLTKNEEIVPMDVDSDSSRTLDPTINESYSGAYVIPELNETHIADIQRNGDGVTRLQDDRNANADPQLVTFARETDENSLAQAVPATSSSLHLQQPNPYPLGSLLPPFQVVLNFYQNANSVQSHHKPDDTPSPFVPIVADDGTEIMEID